MITAVITLNERRSMSERIDNPYKSPQMENASQDSRGSTKLKLPALILLLAFVFPFLAFIPLQRLVLSDLVTFMPDEYQDHRNGYFDSLLLEMFVTLVVISAAAACASLSFTNVFSRVLSRGLSVGACCFVGLTVFLVSHMYLAFYTAR